MKTKLWKRLAAATLAVMMLASLTACGDSSSSQAAASSAAATEAPKTEETAAPAPQEEQQASVAEAPDSTAEAPAATADLKEKWASLKGKTLKVATSGQQAGWSQDDGNGGVEGMDIDVMEYICDYYGINLEWIVADPTGIWGMLQSGEADTIACVTTVNEDRLGAYWFSNTYAWESYCIVSRTEDGVPEAMEHGEKLRFMPAARGKPNPDYVLSRQQFTELRDYVEDRMAQVVDRILGGYFPAKPFYRGPGHDPCSWCKYGSVCQKDPQFRKSCYHAKVTPKEFWALFSKGDEHDG